ncbi:hypothetical protein KIW84_040186 [Lathyrus oleraceus]|uniref:Uncharacterized protein n=1 Tax=Pisum sativum TaxID=3888 RepID=A0A9D4X6V0_PEA|nr:hypothetical protein KIW84_040186 [Pisum sativum]
MFATFQVEDGVTSTSQRPQRTRVRPTRLQDYEVTDDDVVTPDGEFAHFALLIGASVQEIGTETEKNGENTKISTHGIHHGTRHDVATMDAT